MGFVTYLQCICKEKQKEGVWSVISHGLLTVHTSL